MLPLSYLKYKQKIPVLYNKVINFSKKVYIYKKRGTGTALSGGKTQNRDIAAGSGRAIRKGWVAFMEKYYGVAMIAVICVLILFIGAMKQKAEILTTFVLRAFAGAVGIYAVNGMLKSQGLEVVPGVNPVTVLTVGTLGISGFALIYAILFYRLL